MKESNEFCTCKAPGGIYVVNDHWGYWEHCTECDKRLEDGFHYYDEPELY